MTCSNDRGGCVRDHAGDGADSVGGRRTGATRCGRIPGQQCSPICSTGFAPGPSFVSAHRVASVIDCIASMSAGATNTQLDCDTKAPNNEPHIVVDPPDPLHMVASSNDYDSCCDEFYMMFDGGLTWQTGNMSVLTKRRTGSDPVTVFEPKSGNVLHSSLNYVIRNDGQATSGDVVVSISTDGGVNWATPVAAYHGHGADKDPTLRLTSSFLRLACSGRREFVAMAEVLEYRGRRWRNGRGPLTDRLRQSRANWRIIALRDGSASARSLTSGEAGRISSPHGKLMRRRPRSRT